MASSPLALGDTYPAVVQTHKSENVLFDFQGLKAGMHCGKIIHAFLAKHH